MTARPIIFSAPMIRALLDGQKTQTRRIVKPQPAPFVQHTPDRHPTTRTAPYIDAYCGERRAEGNPRGMGRDWHWWTADNRCGERVASCPYGQPGDVLWVRESFFVQPDLWGNDHGPQPSHYAADISHRQEVEDYICKPSIHMPRWASRLTLRITDVRVQRLQEISEADARAEGAPLELRLLDSVRLGATASHTGGFERLWESIHGPDSWASNPWVWCLSFRVIHKNIDEVVDDD